MLYSYQIPMAVLVAPLGHTPDPEGICSAFQNCLVSATTPVVSPLHGMKYSSLTSAVAHEAFDTH